MRDSHVELTKALREARLEIDRAKLREVRLAHRVAELEIECEANREFIAKLARG